MIFTETEFFAVTAYQSEKVRKGAGVSRAGVWSLGKGGGWGWGEGVWSLGLGLGEGAGVGHHKEVVGAGLYR